MTTQTEALNIAIDYMNERLEEHDAKYQRHPATEAERNNILADIEIIKEALMALCDGAQQPQNEVRGLLSNEQVEPTEVRLWDLQWINVVNHDNCYQGWSKEDAINHAVKMTEKYIASNFANNAHPPVPYVVEPRTAQPKEPLVINSQEKASEFIEKTLWEVIDVAAMFPKAKPDPRTWEHLMVYSPQPKEPEQEPMIDKSAAIRIATSLGWKPQRTWIWLTDEERSEIESNLLMNGYGYPEVLAAIEAKLKEKNI